MRMFSEFLNFLISDLLLGLSISLHRGYPMLLSSSSQKVFKVAETSSLNSHLPPTNHNDLAARVVVE